ncbi:MAG: hypothetical protein NBV60_04520 [Erythrobacter sp.]|nr:hypothetical protein [Erythrobacter sp.]
MGGKWRLLALLGYAGLLMWEWATISAPFGGIKVLSFTSLIVVFALAPIAFLCLVPLHRDAMGILALLVIGLGVLLYDLNDGDPIGLMIVMFYQYCAAGLGCFVVLFGAHFIEKER